MDQRIINAIELPINTGLHLNKRKIISPKEIIFQDDLFGSEPIAIDRKTNKEIEINNPLAQYRVIIAGGRKMNDINLVSQSILASGYIPTTIVCGEALGADTKGKEWGLKNKIDIDPYPAQWTRSDGSKDWGAGHKRNSLMAQNADALIAIWNGESTGTLDMIKKALNLNLDVFVYKYDKNIEEQQFKPRQVGMSKIKRNF